ncbi:MAG: bacteriohemerythrin [Oscillospiraceae bacterium]|nr:bacteriohemerythrin [Oscillospiraceae bacterium]
MVIYSSNGGMSSIFERKDNVMIWNEQYETGNELVDSEHKELFSLVRGVLQDSEDEKREKIEESIDFLIKYTVLHFQHEEALMDECNYPESAEHKKLHDEFAKTAVSLKERFAKKGDAVELGTQINTVVCEWLIKHVLNSDKKLATYYKNFKTT